MTTTVHSQLIESLPELFDQTKDGRFFQDHDSMDEARRFAEGVRQICPDMDVEQRSTRVFMVPPA